MDTQNIPDIKDLVNLMANQDTRLMELEKSMGNNKDNIFLHCISSIQNLTKTIENLTLETSMLKLKIGFQFDHKDDMMSFLKSGKDRLFKSDIPSRKRSRVENWALDINQNQRRFEKTNGNISKNALSDVEKETKQVVKVDSPKNSMLPITMSPKNGAGKIDMMNSSNIDVSMSTPSKLFGSNLSAQNLVDLISNKLTENGDFKSQSKTKATDLEQPEPSTENDQQESYIPAMIMENLNPKTDNDKIEPTINVKNERLENFDQSDALLNPFETMNASNLSNDMDNIMKMDAGIMPRLEIDDDSDNDMDDNSYKMEINSKYEPVKRLEFIDLKELTRVMRSTGRINNKYECPIKNCNYSNRILHTVRKHLFVHEISPPPSYGCSLCNKRFKRMDTLRGHFRKHGMILQKSDVRFYRPNASDYVLLEDCEPDEYIT